SADGQDGWMVVRVRAGYDETRGSGPSIARQSTEAWMASYHRSAGRWTLVAVTSTEQPPAAVDGAPHSDWPQFGWDVGRSSASTAPTGINPANVGSLRRRQVALDGTVDASPIYLAGVQVNGGMHDAFFV